MEDVGVPTLEMVNLDLDRALLRQLTLLQDYTNLTLETEKEMREGYFQIARSRYNMGSNSVGRSSLPTEYSERDYRATVRVGPKEDGNPDLVQRELVTMSPQEEEQDQSMKQFGILTSPSLKTSQRSFRRALEKTIERMNITAELEKLQTQFKALNHSKRELLEQEPEA